MTHARPTGSYVRSRRPRRNTAGWMALAGLCFGAAAATWTAVALVAPSMVSASKPSHLHLRAEDPFAPKALVQASVLRPAPLPVEHEVAAAAPKPAGTRSAQPLNTSTTSITTAATITPYQAAVPRRILLSVIA